MNICMVCPRVFPSKNATFVGGHVKSVLRLSKVLSKKHKVQIVTSVPQWAIGRNTETLSYVKVKPFVIKSKMSTWKYGVNFITKVTRQCYDVQREGNLDIYHGHFGYPIYSLSLLMSKCLFKVPVVYTLYCPVPDNCPFIVKRLLRLAINKHCHMVAISKRVRDSLVNIGVEADRVDVIPPVIDDDFLYTNCSQVDSRKTFNLPIDSKVILYIGNLSKEKGIDVLIEAIPSVLKKYPKTVFVLAVDLEIKDSQYETNRLIEIKKRIAAPDMINNVVQVGIIDKISTLMTASDIVVAPFLNTNGPADYPIVLMESMAMGRAVIGTKIGGVPEFVKHEDTGMLAEPGDALGLANNIIDLLGRDNIREQLGINAKNLVKTTFCPERISTMYERVYAKVKLGASNDKQRQS